MENKLKSRLAVIVELLSAPAFVVCLENNKVHATNFLTARHLGESFLENCMIELVGVDTDSQRLQFLKFARKEPFPVLEKCSQKDALFHLMMFSAFTGVVYGTSFAPPLERASSSKTDFLSAKTETAAFHFSYIQNFATGAWTFANADLPMSLGLVEESKNMPSFDWRSIIFKDDLPLYDNTIANLRQHGGNHKIHYRIKTHKGEIIQVCDYCSLAAPDGKWPMLVGSVVSSEKTSRHIQKMEQQILAGRLVGGMIHDFKNLLGGIQSCIEWSISLSENDEVADALHKTLSYTEQATNLISGALKVSFGENDNKIEKIYLSQIVLNLEDLVRRILPASISLHVDLPEKLPPVYGQRGILKNMLLNLCVNARDAMKQKGSKLIIEVATTEKLDEHGGPQLFIVLRVKDDGCGMSGEEVKTVFEAFYSTKESGAGLGLWMVKEAVHSFDGKIDIQSTPGEGSVFEIMFPVADDKKGESEDGAPKESQSNKNAIREYVSPETFALDSSRTALYIEDDPLIRDSVAQWLDKLGFEVLVAEDGQKGLEIFEKHLDDIDVIIQDLILPGRRGDLLFEDFIAAKPEIPIIISSGSSDNEEMARFKQKGAYAILPKPFKVKELITLLDSLFGTSAK